MLLYSVFIVLDRACRVGICCSVFILLLYRFSLSVEMSRLTRGATAEPVPRDQILRRGRGQGNINFPCSADHVQEWQPCPVDPHSLLLYICMAIHTYTVVVVVLSAREFSAASLALFISQTTCIMVLICQSSKRNYIYSQEV